MLSRVLNRQKTLVQIQNRNFATATKELQDYLKVLGITNK
jgi:hypothetical protein